MLTELRLGLPTYPIESFRNAIPVAPELAGRGIVQTLSVGNSTTATAGKKPRGTAARLPRTSAVTGEPAPPGLSPIVRVTLGLSTANTVIETSVLFRMTPISTGGVTIGTKGSALSSSHAVVRAWVNTVMSVARVKNSLRSVCIGPCLSCIG